MIHEHFFGDSGSLIDALCFQCEALLRRCISQTGLASMLVSGGATPVQLFRNLSQADLDWKRVCVALVDERWVEIDSPASNEALVRKNLLQNRASAASFVAMKTGDSSAMTALASCEQAYKELPRPFCLTLLGMGPDGHIASLFPGAEGLERALDPGSSELCTAIMAKQTEVTGKFTERMTLTLTALLQSRQLHLWIRGEEKLAVYQRALSEPDSALLPVSAILHQEEVPVFVYWSP